MKRIIVFAGFVCAFITLYAQEKDSIDIDRFEELEEVIIKGDLPNTRIKGNALITTVEGTPLSTSGTLGEMLAKVPGLVSDGNGLQVLGKGTPLIYINGRLLRDNSELSRLKSEDIRDVEVIHNPGAQYDATVRSVVRIRTKKQKGDGLGLDLALTDEQDLRYGFNTPNSKVSLNYRKNGVDYFGSLWYWDQDSRQYSTLEETTNTSKVFKQAGPYTMTWKNKGFVYTAGVNWQINEKQSVGSRVDLTHYLNGLNKVIYDEEIWENTIWQNHLYSEQTSHEVKPLAWLTNTYYNGTFGKLGIDWNMDYMTTETNTNRENIELTYLHPNQAEASSRELVKSASGAKSNLFATKLILSYPLWKGQLEAGTEATFANRHNSYEIDKIQIGNTKADVKENTLAGFVDYSCNLNAETQASVGLRYEHTLFTYNDLLGTDDLYRTSDDVFPSASIATRLGKVQTSLSYSVKINRPDYFALNDAVTYISRYSMQAGNSKLKNERLQELTWNSSWKFLTLTASYEQSKNCISQWAYILDNDVALIKHFNIDKPIHTVSAMIGITPTIGFYSMNYTLGVQKQNFYMNLENYDGTVRRKDFCDPVFTANLYNTFSLKKDWSIDVNFVFRSKGHSQNFYNSYNLLRMGVVVQKSLLKDKALTLRVAVLDILQRNRVNEYGDMGYYQIQQNNRYSKHKLNLALFYRFNTSRSKYKGTGAGKDAQNRMS